LGGGEYAQTVCSRAPEFGVMTYVNVGE